MLPTHVKQSAGLGIAVVFLLITPVPAQRPFVGLFTFLKKKTTLE